MGLTGVSSTSSVGSSITPADVMGLTGQSITTSVAGLENWLWNSSISRR